jgi:hypothetical protein
MRLTAHYWKMNSNFVFEYEFSRGDDFGWLKAKVETPHFGGRNGMWVQWQDLGNFAASLSAYPITPVSPKLCRWGFGKDGKYTEITKLAIAPKGVTGGLLADVSLANWDEPDNRCSTRFETHYPSLAAFREEIERMLHNRTGSATLYGSADVH